MQTVSITNLREMTGVELVVLDEIVEITSNKTTIGYFVPVDVMGRLQAASRQARQGNAEMALYVLRDVFSAAQEPTDG